MKILRLLLPLVAFLALLAPIAAEAQEWAGRGRLNGTVKDQETGDPIVGATLTLRPANNPDSGPEPIVTNDKGRWSILGLTGGEWTVKVEADGYVPSEGSVRVSEFGPGPNLAIELRKPTAEELAPARASEALEAVTRGNEALQAGEYATARAAYEEALAGLEDQPEAHPAILRGIARTYFSEGNQDQAIATLERALALEPDDVETNQLMANLLVAAGREVEAEAYMAKLPEGSKMDPSALLNLGIRHYNAGEIDQAISYFDRAVTENPEVPEGYYFRGLSYLNKANNEGARTDFRRFLELAPEHEKAAEVKEFLAFLEQEQQQ